MYIIIIIIIIRIKISIKSYYYVKINKKGQKIELDTYSIVKKKLFSALHTKETINTLELDKLPG